MVTGWTDILDSLCGQLVRMGAQTQINPKPAETTN